MFSAEGSPTADQNAVIAWGGVLAQCVLGTLTMVRIARGPDGQVRMVVIEGGDYPERLHRVDASGLTARRGLAATPSRSAV